jgi:predicted transcriptional regulator
MAKTNPFAGERINVAAMNVEIAGPLKKRLDQEALSRRISKRSIIEKALEAYFDPHQEDQREAMIARRLLNLDRRFESIERQNKILAEALAVYVHGWLVQNPEIAGDQKGPANVQARARYTRYIERIARNFETHTTLYDELPQAVTAPSRRAEPVAPDTAAS